MSPKQISNPDDPVHRQLDAICKRFDAAWTSDAAPKIEEFLESLPDDQDNSLLLELVRRDAHQRSLRVESPSLDEYTAQFSEHAALIRQQMNGLLPVKRPANCPAPDPATLPLLPAETTHDSSPRQIGPYALRQKPGEGGMGAMANRHDTI